MKVGDRIDAGRCYVRLANAQKGTLYFNAFFGKPDDNAQIMMFRCYRYTDTECTVEYEVGPIKYGWMPRLPVFANIKEREFLARVTAEFAKLIQLAYIRNPTEQCNKETNSKLRLVKSG